MARQLERGSRGARWNENTLILFNGGSYVRYNLRDRKLGREKDLTDFIGWPSTWADGIDAALEDDDGDTLYLFRGSGLPEFE